MATLTHAKLHYTILKYIIDHGYAPKPDQLASILTVSQEELSIGLKSLQDDHGVVLHPNSDEIWVIHPISLAPTNFVVRLDPEEGTKRTREWWGTCAWCSLGLANLLKQDVTIVASLGADRQQVELHIKDGQLLEKDYVVHFPVPMTNAWDNVIYTCGVMLLFKDEEDVDRWCEQHRVEKGDVRPIQSIWDFAKVWYGSHLNPEWKKWTNKEAKEIFERFGLNHQIWQLPQSDSPF
mmetsp:Transcript_5316/g.6796  ORF Transcript_5316/g.6796 Transcript_5316/m.6796 type:complete len:236 (+) Transcript_5316:146-853(+)|eukprot:CAMPEP_0201490290 /NCGR_PEP_ID=MMETSP0151_2-20130828/26003_1 /ASSEMBLY_ACC=CAM_ASM_000257 /TAXON_ID=200890 /ORGANISM="Paramoeba atlantica, Strain 621/1 / CCAP 1560/9" /LENGTH=235 /DNA_ID=CAMNT_0047876201 /DNA_START=107 /DNA_END=814 /DNA_ORIENTATION=+